MDNVNLNSDEKIVHKTQETIINGVRHEAVLTSQRLILVESETGHIHEDIPYVTIGQAISGVNKIWEPVITFFIHSPGEEQRTIELIFISSIGDKNFIEREKCIEILKEYHIPIEIKREFNNPANLNRKKRADAGELVIEEQISRPAVPDWIIFGASGNNKTVLPEEEPNDRTPLLLIIAMIIILGVLITGINLKAQMQDAKMQPVLLNMTASSVMNEGTPSAIPSPTPTSQVTSVPPASPPLISIPASGVWVRVQYSGNFSGSIGARGRNIEVGGSGTKWYQVPTADTTIDGTIAKLDGTADKLVVEVYKDGKLVSRKSTTSPFGQVEMLSPGTEDITMDVATNVVEMAVIPAPENQAIEDYLPPVSIPVTGVWVRVYYPGKFDGTIGGGGISAPIQSTGDQLYNVPANAGIVEGSVEKGDASGGKMVVEVYKDGVRLSQMVTTKPKGLIDIHVTI